MTSPDQKPARDQFEEQARALAHELPPCDLGSTQAIQAVAIGLREAYRMGRESSKEQIGLLEQTIQNGAEMIRGLTANVERLEAAYDHVKECLHRAEARAQAAENALDKVEDLLFEFGADAPAIIGEYFGERGACACPETSKPY